MTIGGFIAGIAVALVAGWVSRRTPLKEDASFAGFYLGSLALGVTLVSLRGSSVDLLHLLFGSILAVDNDAALFVSGVASLTLLCIALLYRGLVSEAFDSAWLQVNHPRLGAAARAVPGAAGAQSGGRVPGAGHADGGWRDDAAGGGGVLLGANLARHLAAGGADGRLCAWMGLSLSWTANLPAGPSIVLTASGIFFISVFFGTRSRLVVSWRKLMG
jgi:zinc/manganese transport system permease protein